MNLIYKMAATAFAMQVLPPGAVARMKQNVRRTAQQIAKMKGNANLPEQAKAVIPQMEKGLAMQKKMLAAMESIPKSTVDAVRANQGAIEMAMENKKSP